MSVSNDNLPPAAPRSILVPGLVLTVVALATAGSIVISAKKMAEQGQLPRLHMEMQR